MSTKRRGSSQIRKKKGGKGNSGELIKERKEKREKNKQKNGIDVTNAYYYPHNSRLFPYIIPPH